MNGTRNDGSTFRPGAEDPFAELVELIGEPDQKAQASASHNTPDDFDHFVYEGETASSHEGMAEPDFDFDAEFGRQMEGYAPVETTSAHEADDPSFIAASQPEGEWTETVSPRRPFYAEDEQSDVGQALIGLSEPAAPRVAGPAETSAFAPERFVHEPEESSSSETLDDFDELIASEMAVFKAAPASNYPAPADVQHFHDEHFYAQHAVDEHAPAFDEPADVAPMVPRRRARRSGGGSRTRRMMFFSGGVAAVALVAIFGLYAGGDIIAGVAGGGGEPVLIRADTEPFKIEPVDPGGRVVPNQNKAVYERVARNAPMVAPEQDMLISAAEEPLDISFEDEVSNLPGVMVGAADFPEMEPVQVAQAQTPATDIPSILQPHRVRTFDVRPDGTLVPRADPAPAALEAPAEALPGGPEAPFDPATATGEPALPFSADLPATPAAAPAPAVEASAPVTPPGAAAPTPEAPVAAPPAAVAAVEPAAAPAPLPADAHFVQISSQPSEVLAQESMASLSSQYSSVIGGRGMSIQPAEIPDRGTFYRVRITTGSREEANSVCENLQSAGGSCFVTR